jgi:plasmid stabilization system protein ParE
MEKIEELKLQPWRGRPIPEWADENIRYLQAKDYKIIYHVVDEFLLRVLRVFPYKMDFNPDRDLDFE